LERLSDIRKIDAIYFLKAGYKDNQLISTTANLIHAVFPQKISQEHGSAYAFVSRWLSKECSNFKIPYVEHIVMLPKVNDNLRAQLSIPIDANVFGYLGGRDSFNIKFVHEIISNTKKNHNFFIFMNVDPFCNQENVIFMPPTLNLEYKTRFINTCDAMIHARSMGESFGLACAEFSIKNKPIITFALCEHKNHIDILDKKAILYHNREDLKYILDNFDRKWSALQSWDCYSNLFSPQIIMEKFQEVFLDHNKFSKNSNAIFSLKDKIIIESRRLKRKFLRHKAKQYR
jgi:hypothetical protein